MSADQSVPSTTLPAASAASSVQAPYSRRTSPHSSSTTSEKNGMSTTGYLPASQVFRSGLPTHSPFPLNVATSHLFEREPPQPVAALFSSSPAPTVRVLIRRLPLNTSEDSLRLMFVFSKELVNVELQPVEQSEDQGFRSAILRFKTMNGAVEAKNMLDGRSNISNDAEMVVEILASPPLAARRLPTDGASVISQGSTTSAGSLRQPQRYNGGFPNQERVSPTSNGLFSHEFSTADTGSHYKALFSPQSPIGNHLTERTGFSSKYLINNDFGDDDETSDLLKDPVAYAENGSGTQRRATAPQIPIGQMAGLTLNTTNQHGPSSLPPYINSMSPVNANGGGSGYPGAGQPYGRPNFPPVNPADQNPPCNTLYVGNLPIDTSEEELKAMFSKQRGYKRLCFRTKQNGPMCFVEFEDVSFATKALHELYGQPLHNSVKGGIRLSFSKNPLGVRSAQAPPAAAQAAMSSLNGGMPGMANGFTSASGPPPGLSAPPGLGQSRINYNGNSAGRDDERRRQHHFNGYTASATHGWNGPFYTNGMTTSHSGVAGTSTNSSHFPRHMMGR